MNMLYQSYRLGRVCGLGKDYGFALFARKATANVEGKRTGGNEKVQRQQDVGPNCILEVR